MKSKRITRLVQLLTMLQGGRGQKWDGLAKTFGVGRRTIFRDLETLRLAGVPVEFDARTQRYSIQSGNFGPPSDLTAEEAFSIWALANSLGAQSKSVIHNAASTAVPKLLRQLPRKVKQDFRDLLKAISFQPQAVSPMAIKTAVYKSIVEAIKKRRAILVDYDSLTEWERIHTTICPYRLAFIKRSWYVIGHSSLHNEVRTFNVMRIESLKVLEQRYSIPRTFELNQKIGNSWTMISSSGPNHRVRLKFGSQVARNVEMVNWHKTQRTTLHADGTLDFEVTISGLDEIIWWILGYGDQVEVKHPYKLKRLVAQRVKKMASNYKHTIADLERVG